MMRMVRRRLICAALLALTAAPAVAQKEASLGDIDISTLYVEVSDADGNFTVVDARVDETGTAGVFFGVVGAGINSAANASQDDKKADTLRAAAAELDLKSIVLAAVTQTLAARESVPLSLDQAGASHTLLVEIHNWGLMRKNRETQEMRVFLNLSIDLLDEKKKTVWRKKRENNVGQKAEPFEAFTPAMFKEEMERLAQKSGQHVAYQIIYR